MNANYQTFGDFNINIFVNVPNQLNINLPPIVEKSSELDPKYQRRYAFYFIHNLKGENVQFRREMTIYQKCETKKPKSFAFINRELYVFNAEIKHNMNGEPISASPIYLAFAGKKYTLLNNSDYIDRNGPFKNLVSDLARNGKVLITEVYENNNEQAVAIIPNNTLFWIDDEIQEDRKSVV